MSYSEALERWAQAADLLARPSWPRLHATLAHHPALRGREELAAALLRHTVERARPYYVEADICRLLRAMVERGAPAWTITEDELPTPYGFCWFAADPVPPDEADSQARLRAISWGPVYARPGAPGHQPEFSAVPLPGATALCVIEGWYGTSVAPGLPAVPMAGVAATLGAVLDSAAVGIAPAGSTFTPADLRDARQVAALFTVLTLFLQQRVLVAASERADRATRRRLERAGWPDGPLVRVVALRRSERQHGEPPASPGHVDWAYRWVVRGHWRRQWLPSLRRHQPRWIAPHVKGPDDRPLKPPATTVFAVTR
jgi:hypothetical protein